MKLLFCANFLLVCVSASPYVVTSYFEVVKSTNDPGSTRTRYTGAVEVETTTQYVTPTGSANPLTAVTSVKDHLFTHVDIEIPQGAGALITQSISPTSYGVAITYHRCTSSASAGESAVAIPPDTRTAFLSFLPHMTNLPTPLTSFISTSSVNENRTSFPVVILHPTDIDPVELAAKSEAIQPQNCLAATTSVDYRNACEFGPSSRMKPAPADISCGESNPCCFDCRGQSLRCIRNCDDWDDRPFRKCADGRTYYPDGVTSIDPMYTMDLPQETQGEWTEEQRESDGNATESIATALAPVNWLFFRSWLYGGIPLHILMLWPV